MENKNLNLPIYKQEIQPNFNLYQQNNYSLIHPQYQPSHFSDNCINNIVKTLPPIYRERLADYALVECQNVTTSWIKQYGFSYLSKYNSDENFFFLPLTNDGFNLNKWSEYSTKNKISREKLNEFISQLNSQFQLKNLIKTAKRCIDLVIMLSIILSILGFILCILFLILELTNILKKSYTY